MPTVTELPVSTLKKWLDRLIDQTVCGKRSWSYLATHVSYRGISLETLLVDNVLFSVADPTAADLAAQTLRKKKSINIAIDELPDGPACRSHRKVRFVNYIEDSEPLYLECLTLFNVAKASAEKEYPKDVQRIALLAEAAIMGSDRRS